MKIYIVKITNESLINGILKLDNFIHDGIYNFGTEIEKDDPVFIYFGGDKGQITWDQGLRAVGKIVKPPFDIGYENSKSRNFKIEIQPLHKLQSSISPKKAKIHPQYAEDLYDVPYVGANHPPTQAIAKTDTEGSINALMRLYEEFAFSEDISNIWEMIPLLSNYRKSEEELKTKKFIDNTKNANLQLNNYTIKRFISSLCSKPFLILTGLSGSGKTKLAQAFSNWITNDLSSIKQQFQVGEEVLSERVTYIVTAGDKISVTFMQKDTRVKVNLPYDLIKEWMQIIKEKNFPVEISPRTIRELVNQNTTFSSQLNSFETQLKAASFALLKKPIYNSSLKQSCFIPVGSDWTNREPLLGYPDALNHGKYIKPDNGVLDLIIESNKYENSKKPFFLILDEMNLSHVERYFADFLSAMESSEPIPLHSGETEWDGVPPELKLPENIFIIGTVNIDETTYMFSPKVLDRANVIEFRVTDAEMKEFLGNPLKPDFCNLKGAGSSMATDFFSIATNSTPDYSDKEALKTVLMGFFTELKKVGAEFGYRTASEIYRFAGIISMLTEREGDKWNLNQIADAAIMQKLLPKLHGSRRKLEPVLKLLAGLCLTDDSKAANYLKEYENLDLIDPAKVSFPISLEKIIRMYNRAQKDGFTSFAEA